MIFTGIAQEDAFEGFMLLTDIMNKRFVPCSTDNRLPGTDSPSEYIWIYC